MLVRVALKFTLTHVRSGDILLTEYFEHYCVLVRSL